jgi:hypothetical protein
MQQLRTVSILLSWLAPCTSLELVDGTTIFCVTIWEQVTQHAVPRDGPESRYRWNRQPSLFSTPASGTRTGRHAVRLAARGNQTSVPVWLNCIGVYSQLQVTRTLHRQLSMHVMHPVSPRSSSAHSSGSACQVLPLLLGTSMPGQ